MINPFVAKSGVLLSTYTGRHSLRRALSVSGLLLAMIAFCFLYGAAYAVFTPHILVVLALPLLLIAVVMIWSLPDMANPPLLALTGLFYANLVALYVWPNYLALALPGLPWITVARLIGTPLVGLFLICLSTSKDLRVRFSMIWRESLPLNLLVVIFTCIQAVSILFSDQKSGSIDKFVIAVTTQTALYFIAACLATRKEQVRRVAITLWGLALFVSFIGLWQYKIKHLPWDGHVPSFLQISDPLVAAVMAGFSRAYTNVYRITSTFTTPLGLSEFLALTFPFVMYFVVEGRSLLTKILAALSLPILLLTVLLTDSRLGVIGCLLALMLYPLAIGLRQWRRNPKSLIGPAVGVAYPALFIAVIASTFVVGHVRNVVWGSGAKSISTQGRIEQWHLGLPLILHRPEGYGIGRAADTLGYAPFGFETIDSYYLSVVLDYGVIGFLVFYAIFLIATVKTGLLAINPASEDETTSFSIPLAIALAAWLVIKSVFSEPDNSGLTYILLGVATAVAWRAGSSARARASERPNGSS